jgi:predicted MPP superfamily phosphohydrolase
MESFIMMQQILHAAKQLVSSTQQVQYPLMPRSSDDQSKRKGKYRRARIRNFLFTIGPNRLSGGRISQRHLAQEVAIREIDVKSPRWPKALNGLRIGHVSDFHLGELLPLDRALAVVDQLAAQEPDFVACTGDVVDLHHTEVRPLLDALAGIDAPLGSALVLGNHDELHCPDTVQRLGIEAGLHVLRNEAIKINHNGEHLIVGGIDWARTASQCAKFIDLTVGDAAEEGAHLLLAHNPKAFARASQLSIPLTLSGHTHGGQLALKNRPNTNLAVGHRQSAGLFAQGDSRLFVTTGIGAWFPLRVNCPAEIVMITMHHDDSADTNSPSAAQREHDAA